MRRVLACTLAVVACVAAVAAAEPVPAEARAQVLALADARRFDGATLGALARHPDAGVREAAARAVGELANPAGVALLAQLANDPEPGVRAAAAQGAGRLASMLPEKAAEREALGRELRRLVQDKEPGVRAAAAWGAGMAALNGSDLWVLQRLSLEKSPAVEAALLQELWRFPGTLWIKRATTFIASRDARVRLAAAWSLARSGEGGGGRRPEAGGRRQRPVGADGGARGRSAAQDQRALVRAAAGVTDSDARVRMAALQGRRQRWPGILGESSPRRGPIG